MYGLAKDTDLTFLLGKQLERVEVSEYQAQLHFSGSISISIEGECELNNTPVAYGQLKQLISDSVVGVTIQDDGTTSLAFVHGNKLSLRDSNSSYESYQITTPDVTIIV